MPRLSWENARREYYVYSPCFNSLNGKYFYLTRPYFTSLSWLVENGFKYTRSNGGCWKYGPVKADESLVKDLQDHIETSAECAYYKIGSG